MEKFIKVTHENIGPIYISTESVIYFWKFGEQTEIKLKYTIYGKNYIHVKESCEDIINQLK